MDVNPNGYIAIPKKETPLKGTKLSTSWMTMCILQCVCSAFLCSSHINRIFVWHMYACRLVVELHYSP